MYNNATIKQMVLLLTNSVFLTAVPVHMHIKRLRIITELPLGGSVALPPSPSVSSVSFHYRDSVKMKD